MLRYVLALMLLFAAAPLAAQQPGFLISQEPMAGAPPGAKAWRIRYMSRNDRGQPVEVTGVVVAPDGPAPRFGRKVIAWAHGAWGVTSKCAPSLSANFFGATPGVQEAIARGYVFTATDYAGLGISEQQHAFLVGSSAAYNVLDSVRAAHALGESGAGTRYAVWGESQGGHASLFTGQYAKQYAPELMLMGVAAAAPPTDLPKNLISGSDPSIRAYMTAFTAYSWSRHFGYPLSSLGKKSTQDIINKLGETCVTLTTKPKLSMIIGVTVLRLRLKNVDLGKLEPWAGTARANSVGTQPYGIPLLIAQNEKDALVAASVTKDFARSMCRNGATLRYIPMTTKTGHATSARDSTKETLDWFDARFAGQPAPSDCGRI